jgi:hypothetical protein
VGNNGFTDVTKVDWRAGRMTNQDEPVNSNPDLFGALDQYGAIVSLMSGVRTKFIESGWSHENAERATISLFSRVHSDNR